MRARVYYPLFADLSSRQCVVIGGGQVAQRKVTALLKCGARIRLISPEATKRLRNYARKGLIQHWTRQFRAGDLKGAWLVYAATDDTKINQMVHREAVANRIFANVVDQTPLCTFIAPAIFRKGPLTIAISTGGLSPSLSKYLRSELAALIDAGYLPMLRLLKNLRGTAKRKIPRYQDRKVYFDAIVRGRVFQLMRQGKPKEAKKEALLLLKRYAA